MAPDPHTVALVAAGRPNPRLSGGFHRGSSRLCGRSSPDRAKPTSHDSAHQTRGRGVATGISRSSDRTVRAVSGVRPHGEEGLNGVHPGPYASRRRAADVTLPSTLIGPVLRVLVIWSTARWAVVASAGEASGPMARSRSECRDAGEAAVDLGHSWMTSWTTAHGVSVAPTDPDPVGRRLRFGPQARTCRWFRWSSGLLRSGEV